MPQMWIPAPLPTNHQPQAQNLHKQAVANLFPNVRDAKLTKPYEVSHRHRYPTKFSSSPLNPNPSHKSASEKMDPEIAMPQQVIHLDNCHVKNPSETFILLCKLRAPRTVKMREGWTLDLKVMRNAEAFAITAMGELREGEGRCEQCKEGKGPFTKCVTVPGCEKGACGCCVYGAGDGDPKCSLWFGSGFKPRKESKKEKEKKKKKKLDTTAIEEAVARGFAERFNTDGPPPRFPPELIELPWMEFLVRGDLLQKAFNRIENEVMLREKQDKIIGASHLGTISNRHLLTTWDALSKDLTDWKRVKAANQLHLWEGWRSKEYDDDSEDEEDDEEYEEVARNAQEASTEPATENNEAEKAESDGTTGHTKEEKTNAIKNILGLITHFADQQSKGAMGNTRRQGEITETEAQIQQCLFAPQGRSEISQDITEAERLEIEFGETVFPEDDAQEGQPTGSAMCKTGSQKHPKYRAQKNTQQLPRSTEATQHTTPTSSPIDATDSREERQQKNPQQTSMKISQFDAGFDEQLISEDELEQMFAQQVTENQQAGKRNKTPPEDEDDDDQGSEARRSKKLKFKRGSG